MTINSGGSVVYNVIDMNKKMLVVNSTDLVTIIINNISVRGRNLKIARIGAKSVTLKNENTSSIDVTITEE